MQNPFGYINMGALVPAQNLLDPADIPAGVDRIHVTARGPLTFDAGVAAVGEGLGGDDAGWLVRTAAALVLGVSRRMAVGLDAAFDTSLHGADSIASTAGVLWEPVDGRVLSFGVGPSWETRGVAAWQATAALTAGFDGR